MGPYYATSCHWLLTASGIDTQIHMPTSLTKQTKYTLATIPGLSKVLLLSYSYVWKVVSYSAMNLACSGTQQAE